MQNIMIEFGKIVLGTFIGIIIEKTIDYFRDNKNHLRLSFVLLFHRHSNVRISVAYLFKIYDQCKNEFLLIRGSKIDQYQPIGGVYKTYQSFRDTKEQLEIKYGKDENFYENGDLRLYLPGKNVIKFLRWFNEGKNREVNTTREFYEELIAPGYLPEDVLFGTEFEFLKQDIGNFRKTTYFPGADGEVLVRNVYEISFNDENIMRKLRENASEGGKLMFINSDDIKREAVKVNGVDVKIGEHTKLLL